MSPRHRYYRQTVWHRIPGWWYAIAWIVALGVGIAVVASGGIGLDGPDHPRRPAPVESSTGAPTPDPAVTVTVTDTITAKPSPAPTKTIRVTSTRTATKEVTQPGPTVTVPGPTVTETQCNTVTYGTPPASLPPSSC